MEHDQLSRPVASLGRPAEAGCEDPGQVAAGLFKRERVAVEGRGER
jgi:hypothetical protein